MKYYRPDMSATLYVQETFEGGTWRIMLGEKAHWLYTPFETEEEANAVLRRLAKNGQYIAFEETPAEKIARLTEELQEAIESERG